MAHFVASNAPLASILETDSNTKKSPTATKIIGTVGLQTQSKEKLEELLEAGMTTARFDFSWNTQDYHQRTLDNLKEAMAKTKQLCAIMLDTKGPEITIPKKLDTVFEITAGSEVTLTADLNVEASASIMPVTYDKIADAVNIGDTIFIGQYLFTGSETTSCYLEVVSKDATSNTVVCKAGNCASLGGIMLTVILANVRNELPTISDEDVNNITTWGVKNKIDFLSLSVCRCEDDVLKARSILKSCGLTQTKIMAKIEEKVGLTNFEKILDTADGIILSRGNLGLDIPPEKMFLIQKFILERCNNANKPAVITRVVDTMCDVPRPTRAEATDVANAVLDGADCILLGAETLRGLFPVETVKTVSLIAKEAERKYDHVKHYDHIVKRITSGVERVPGKFDQSESMASSAVRACVKCSASLIIVFSQTGRTAALLAKYRPPVPILAVFIPELQTDGLQWYFSGEVQARQGLMHRGLFPILADPGRTVATPGDVNMSNGDVLQQDALKWALERGMIAPGDRVVVSQKLRESSVIKVVEA
eukprot:CAMPEP_0197856444 /NCGR_PEP_ID=MMETSP1438-20131217/28582_1 /TAXON_ID=1461541 /ORGANISM="Pterosperma sp., Strain CCMP1384" /LENGTH=535 /DNA_ID=CAMNT_0043471901 /DNA_START=89 /DNA_END=1696 /DNA_ORIENTATION=+